MKNLAIYIVLFSAVLFCSCIRRADSVYGFTEQSTEKVSKNIQTADFNEVDVRGGGFTVYYVQSDTTSVRIESTKRTMERIAVENKGGRLTIYMKTVGDDDCNKGDGDGPSSRYVWLGKTDGHDSITVYLSSKQLQEVNLSGSADFISEKPLVAQTFGMNISGSGDISVADVTAKNVSANIAGSGDIVFLARKADVDISIAGSGDVAATLRDCGTVSSSIVGSGDIRLSGNAKHAENSMAGSGNIDIDNLKTSNE